MVPAWHFFCYFGPLGTINFVIIKKRSVVFLSPGLELGYNQVKLDIIHVALPALFSASGIGREFLIHQLGN